MPPRFAFDLEDLPAEPPDGADPMMWRLAWRLANDHALGSHHHCAICTHDSWPCDARGLAELGLLRSFLRRGPFAGNAARGRF